MVRTFVVMVLIGFAWAADAHDDAEWIQRGRFQNAVGQLCCGVNDCRLVPDEDVRIVPGGYHVISLRETVPYSEAQPSPDGKYWRCAWPTIKDRKCFFAPPPSM